jgi:enoyl-CoA hydratase/carnithine racemase
MSADPTSRTSDDPVLVDRCDHVVTVTFNRPEAKNAVNAAMATVLGSTLAAADRDETVRAVIVTGVGDAFCAGADLKALAAGESIHANGHPEWGFAGMVRQYVDVPVIAAVNGTALGGGTEIVLAADVAVASELATFGLPEVRRGLIAAGGGLLRLPHQVGIKGALELALTGDRIDAGAAHERGLVNRVVAADAVLDEAWAIARSIAANAPRAVRESKRLLHAAAATGSAWSEPAWQLEDETFGRVRTSEDAREGASAFAEKRPPHWTGA